MWYSPRHYVPSWQNCCRYGIRYHCRPARGMSAHGSFLGHCRTRHVSTFAVRSDGTSSVSLGFTLGYLCRLVHADSCFESLIGLTEPVRTSVRLLKTAIALGEFAVGRWMPWDTVEFPSDKLLHGLGIDSPEDIIDEVRTDLESLGSIETEGEEANKHFTEIAETPPKRLAYCNLSTEAFDTTPPLLASMNYALEQIPSSERYLNDNVVVNCLHAPAACLAAQRGHSAEPSLSSFLS